MDFFSAQDNARRKTWQLTALFVIAVVALAVAANVLIGFSLGFLHLNSASGQPVAFNPYANWPWVTAAVVAIVLVASAFKYLQISGGGRAVAEALGGKPLTFEAADRSGRRLLNIVEEMALAAGTPVPPVYVLPEASINAFAAGFNLDDAVVGVTQGTIDHLSRDELQGVVAHEFSHIINADTRINLRLIAVLHGLLCLGIVGYHLMRAGGYSDRNKAAPLMMIGLACVIIGYAGTFFGNLIKAAVSRQREYLADASAVQFTRNPEGIAGALKKIGALSYGSRLDTERASEASHMFFSQAINLFMNGLLATHPPLPKRIRAIDPGWNGRFPALNVPHGASVEASGEASNFVGATTASFAGAASAEPASALLIEPASELRVEPATEAVSQAGELSERSIERAAALIAATDQQLKAAARDAYSARALVYAMLLDESTELRRRQRSFLTTNAEPGVPELIDDLIAPLDSSTRVQRINLLQLAVPSLKQLSRSQYERFKTNVAAMIRSDGEVALFEWVLHRVLTQELRSTFEKPTTQRVRYRRVSDAHKAVISLLANLAREGHQRPSEAAAAHAAGLSAVGLSATYIEEPRDQFGGLNEALADLRALAPLRKPAVLKACIATAAHDGVIRDREAALLQGIAATLDCPLPGTVFS